MKINWKVRFKNKTFWLAIIPAIAMLLQAVANVFGFVIDLGDIANNLIAVIEAAFVVLAIMGIVTDPTTAGISDSDNAMTYSEPKK